MHDCEYGCFVLWVFLLFFDKLFICFALCDFYCIFHGLYIYIYIDFRKGSDALPNVAHNVVLFFLHSYCYSYYDYYYYDVFWENDTSVGFGLVNWEFEFVTIVDDAVGRFTNSGSIDTIGFFVGFGFTRDGNFSHCVGLSFVTKFGCVVTCHCVVWTSWFHKPSVINSVCFRFSEINKLSLDFD